MFNQRKPKPPNYEKPISSQTPKRVVDVLDKPEGQANSGKKENPVWWGNSLSYDKNFRHFESCMNYDKAIEERDMDQADQSRREIYAVVDMAFKDFSAAIFAGLPDRIVVGQTLREYLEIIGEQIDEAKRLEKHPRELLEIVLIKLSILRDLSNTYDIVPWSDNEVEVEIEIGKIYIRDVDEMLQYKVMGLDGKLIVNTIPRERLAHTMHEFGFKFLALGTAKEILSRPSYWIYRLCEIIDETEHGSIPNHPFNIEIMDDVACYSASNKRQRKRKEYDDRLGHYVNYLMHLPLTVATQTLKDEVGPGFMSPLSHDGVVNKRVHQKYLENTSVLPFYSRNGSMGFNTVLCAIFNDYLPVGFGVDPMAVHTNFHKQQSFWTARHDYGHCFKRLITLKEENPDFFENCRQTYFRMFNDRMSGKIDDMTLKKELLVLFLMVYELGNSYISRNTIKKAIIENAASLEEGRAGSEYSRDYFKRDAYNISEQYRKRKEMEKGKRPRRSKVEKEIMHDALNRMTVLDLFDFVKPLQDLGYQFPDNVSRKPWEAAPMLRKGLLELFEQFNQRHPNFYSPPKPPQSTYKPKLPEFDQQRMFARAAKYRSPEKDSGKKPEVRKEKG